MADGSTELEELDRSIRRIDDKIATNLRTQQEQKDVALSWQALNFIGGADVARPHIKDSNHQVAQLQVAHAQLRQSRERAVQRRQRLLTRQATLHAPRRPPGEFRPMPGSFPSPGTAIWGPPPKLESGPSRSTPATSQRNESSKTPSPSWRSRVEPIDFMAGSKQHSTDRFVSNMVQTSRNPSSGAFTPIYRGSPTPTGNKRSLHSPQNAIDLTRSGPSKRPRGPASTLAHQKSPSRSRPKSSDSTDSSVIDLTGDDDDIRASIDSHRKRADEARRRSIHGGGRLHPAASSHSMPTASRSQTEAAQPNDHGITGRPSWLDRVDTLMMGNSQPMPAFPPAPARLPFSSNFGGYISSDEERDGPSFTPAPHQHPGAPRLQNIINRVNQFDYDTMTDGLGNPIDQRIATYARDVMADPRMSKSDIDHLLANIHPDMDIPEEDRTGTPPAMTYPLYKHQQIALDWMRRQEEGVNKGGILADDMGLGKTVSMLALIVSRQAKQGADFTDQQKDAGQVDTSQPWFFTKTNLIVLPKALIRQWEDEIKRKLRDENSLSVAVFHGSRKMTAKELLKYDVVLTTYGTLLADFTRLQRFWKEHEGRNVNMDTDVTLARDVCLFHPKHSLFWRVILDESQHIKNDRSKSTEAACQLMSSYRWCMSGTPMMNSLEEIYPLFRFLRITPYKNKSTFRRAFGTLYGKGKSGSDPKSRAMTNFQVVLKATMLRRSKTSKLDGEPIVKLPNKTEEVVHVTMQEEERKFYDELANNTRVTINEYIRKGTLGKHYSHVLELLLRLRQACCHPHLLDAQEAQPDVDDEMLALAMSMDPTVIERIIAKARDIVASAEGGFECPVCYETISDPNLPLPCGHEICAPCFQAHMQNAALDNVREGEEGAGAKCPVCRVIIQSEKVVTFKAFRKVHIPDLIDDEEEKDSEDSNDDDVGADSDSDDSDGADDADADDVDGEGNLKDFINDDDVDYASDTNKENHDATATVHDKVGNDLFSDDDEADDGICVVRKLRSDSKRMPKGKKTKLSKNAEQSDAGCTKKIRKKKVPRPKSAPSSTRQKRQKVKPSMLRHLRQEGRKNKEAKRQYRRYLAKNWMPSAKITACLDLLKKIRDESDGEKTIIFSQWTMLMDFVEVALARDPELKTVDAVRFDGEMSMPERDRAVGRFRDNDRTKIMLVSLRAGNAGLNLVAASRVIILDPFWNPFIEMQAVDRAHRIGQQREVTVYRLLVKGTVEDRIMEIKAGKEKMINSALDEGAAKKISGLSISDLKRLFDV